MVLNDYMQIYSNEKGDAIHQCYVLRDAVDMAFRHSTLKRAPLLAFKIEYCIMFCIVNCIDCLCHVANFLHQIKFEINPEIADPPFEIFEQRNRPVPIQFHFVDCHPSHYVALASRVFRSVEIENYTLHCDCFCCDKLHLQLDLVFLVAKNHIFSLQEEEMSCFRICSVAQ